MLRRVIKSNHSDRIHFPDLICQLLRRIVFDIRYHHFGGSICNKLLLHQIQSDTRLRRIGQISRQLIFHLDPVS